MSKNEKIVLDFERRQGNGAEVKQLQYSEIIKQGKHFTFHYIQAIPVSGNYLSCYAEPLKNKLKQLYLIDKVTGFNLDDICSTSSITRKVR
ncbi:MAG: hypothetical protein QM500_18345 [Methylococcales bacterium]